MTGNSEANWRAHFPPKTVGIIGVEGLMGSRHLSPFWKRAGLTVIGADVEEKREWNPELVDNQTAAQADIVNITVRPMAETWKVLAEIEDFIRPGALVLISSTVQNPAGINTTAPARRLRARDIDVGLLHFMWGPTVDDWEGQNVAVGFREPMKNRRWRSYLHRRLARERMRIWPVSFSSHDDATTFSQINGHIKAFLSAVVWSHMDYPVEELVEFMPPTGYLPAYGEIAILRQPELSAEMLVSHRRSLWLLDLQIGALQKMRQAVKARNAKEAHSLYPNLRLPRRRAEVIRLRTQMHVRLEGGLRGGGFMYWLSKAANTVGKLTRMLRAFDALGLHKTQTFGSEDPSDGSATVLITVSRPVSAEAVKAHLQILNDPGIGASELRPQIPHGKARNTFYREEEPID